MIVTTEYVDIALAGSPMRTFVAAPKAEGGVSGDLVLLGYFSTDAADVADLRSAGGVWICCGRAGDLPED
jgi:hypothetical protein